MLHRLSKKYFTLTEVMIATVVLGLAVAATAAIVSGAQATILKSENRWARQHLATNATEFFLMAGPQGQVPSDILPEGFSAQCTLLEVDDIHEEAMEPISGWIIGEYLVEVFDRDGNRMTETHVRKILKEDDFE